MHSFKKRYGNICPLGKPSVATVHVDYRDWETEYGERHQHLWGFLVYPWGQIYILIEVESFSTYAVLHPNMYRIKGHNREIHSCITSPINSPHDSVLLYAVKSVWFILYLAVHKQVPYTTSIVFVLQLWIFIWYVLTDSAELQNMTSIQVPGNEKSNSKYTSKQSGRMWAQEKETGTM